MLEAFVIGVKAFMMFLGFSLMLFLTLGFLSVIIAIIESRRNKVE